MSYVTPYQISQALAAGAGDKPGQTHVDDYVNANNISSGPTGNLFGRLQEQMRPTGIGSENGGMLDYNTAQRQLQEALKLDPNAHLEKVGSNDKEYSDDGVALNNYILHMDNSKLPKFKGGNVDVSKGGGWTSLNTNNAGQRVIDPNYVVHDPNYGDYTIKGNLKQADNDKMDSTWKAINMAAHYAPMVLGAGAGLGAFAGSGMGGNIFSGLQTLGNTFANGGKLNPMMLMQILKYLPKGTFGG